MAITKLREGLDEMLKERGVPEMNAFQSEIIDALKAGKNILAEGPLGSGKSKAILYCLLQKIAQPGEGSPRAIVICNTNDDALNLHAEIQKAARHMDLTIDLANDKGNMLQQRNDIFDGTEIIIGNPRRIYDLYIQNGFNVSQLKLFILDDATTLFKNGYKMQLSRIVESLPKCQHLYLADNFKDRRIEDYMEEFLPVYQNIKVKEIEE